MLEKLNKLPFHWPNHQKEKIPFVSITILQYPNDKKQIPDKICLELATSHINITHEPQMSLSTLGYRRGTIYRGPLSFCS